MIAVRISNAQQTTAPLKQQVQAARDQIRNDVRHALHDARDGLRDGLRNGILLQGNQTHVAVVQGAPATAERPERPERPERQELPERIEQPERAEVQGTPGSAGTPGVPGTPGIPGTIALGDEFTASNDFPPQIADISIAFFVMCAVMVIGWPIARALGRRLEPSGKGHAVDAGMTEQLHRIEQAVDAMAIEVERISESQRFMAQLQNKAAVEHVALAAVDRG